jgi:hypothetical protein
MEPACARAAGAATAGLGLVTAAHVAWAAGVTWPFGDADELADAVVGHRPFPSAALTSVVAGALAVATVLNAGQALDRPRAGVTARARRHGVRLVAGVLLLRGAAGPLASALAPDRTTAVYHRWDRRLYSPLCLALATTALLGTASPAHRQATP